MPTLVLGASPNPRRYSHKATEELSNAGYDVIPVGIRQGNINELQIQSEFPAERKIDTIAMYLSAENQKKYYENILTNLPRRVVFNPGTFNPDFQETLRENGVIVINDCVLMMLSRKIY